MWVRVGGCSDQDNVEVERQDRERGVASPLKLIEWLTNRRLD